MTQLIVTLALQPGRCLRPSYTETKACYLTVKAAQTSPTGDVGSLVRSRERFVCLVCGHNKEVDVVVGAVEKSIIVYDPTRLSEFLNKTPFLCCIEVLGRLSVDGVYKVYNLV
jgi:hypothetical protein